MAIHRSRGGVSSRNASFILGMLSLVPRLTVHSISSGKFDTSSRRNFSMIVVEIFWGSLPNFNSVDFDFYSNVSKGTHTQKISLLCATFALHELSIYEFLFVEETKMVRVKVHCKSLVLNGRARVSYVSEDSCPKVVFHDVSLQCFLPIGRRERSESICHLIHSWLEQDQ